MAHENSHHALRYIMRVHTYGRAAPDCSFFSSVWGGKKMCCYRRAFHSDKAVAVTGGGEVERARAGGVDGVVSAPPEANLGARRMQEREKLKHAWYWYFRGCTHTTWRAWY